MGKANQDKDNNQLSGIADVKSTEDNHGKTSGTLFIALSGQTGPNAAWYQFISGIISPNVPNTQITSVVNSLYTAPPNQNISVFQSGKADVPKSESSITH